VKTLIKDRSIWSVPLQIDSGLVGGLQIRMGLYKRHVRRNCLHPA
jgi:hypothetical protein